MKNQKTSESLHQEIRAKIQERQTIAEDTLRLAVLINENRSKRVRLSEEIKKLVPQMQQAKRDEASSEKKPKPEVKKNPKTKAKKSEKTPEVPVLETPAPQPITEVPVQEPAVA